MFRPCRRTQRVYSKRGRRRSKTRIPRLTQKGAVHYAQIPAIRSCSNAADDRPWKWDKETANMRLNAMEVVRSGRLVRLAAGAVLFCHVAFAGSRPPNLVFILAADLGWSDLGCYGADLHETPNIDRLAQEGVRFTQAYAMPGCSPTHASILTSNATRSSSTTPTITPPPRPSVLCAPATGNCWNTSRTITSSSTACATILVNSTTWPPRNPSARHNSGPGCMIGGRKSAPSCLRQIQATDPGKARPALKPGRSWTVSYW